MNNAVRAAVVLITGLAVAAVSAQDFARAKIMTVPVVEGIYVLMGPGGNIGVSIGADGVFIIDDQFAPLNQKITAAIAALSDEPVKMVLNTHWHNDHTGGNEAFSNAGAIIVAHDNVRTRMSASQFSQFFQRAVPASPKAALPVVTFDASVTLHLNGHTIRAEHVPPAHTDGDSLVWFEEANVVHMGDTFFNGFYPFIDSDSGGSITGMIAAIDLVLPRLTNETRVIPGHGPVSDRAGLTEFRDMLRTVAARIQVLIDQGQPLEAVVSAKPTADFDARWGQGFIKPDQWVELVYRGMLQ